MLWLAGSCATLSTAVRYYKLTDAFAFVTTTPSGANGTATSPLSLRARYRGRHVSINASTEFPSFPLPLPRDAGIGWLTWDGTMLHGPAQIARPRSQSESDDMHSWSGGLVGGPLVLFNNVTASHPNGVVLGPGATFKVGVLTRRAGRLVCGAQGMVTSLPPRYSLQFVLLGRVGITHAMAAWGDHLQRGHSTAATKLTLADDELSDKLSYLTDGVRRPSCHV